MNDKSKLAIVVAADFVNVCIEKLHYALKQAENEREKYKVDKLIKDFVKVRKNALKTANNKH